MIHARLFLIAPVLLVSSCALFSKRSSDTPDQPVMANHIDNSMLQHVSPGDRADITEARKAADAARDAYSAAKAESIQTTDRRKVCSQELEIARAEQKRAEAVQTAAQNGSEEELNDAKQGVAEAKTLVTSVQSRIELRDVQVEHAAGIEELKLKENELAQARVELAAARAVKRLNRPESKSVDVAAYERQVRKQQEEVKLAEVRADALHGEVKAARMAYDKTVKAVPAHYSRDWPSEEESASETAQRPLHD